MTTVLALASLAAALAAIAAMASWGMRERFDPFDAWLLAIAGYVGCLIVAGFVLDALPGGLSRPMLLGVVLAGGVVGASLIAFVWRPRLPRPRRPRRPLVSALIVAMSVVSLGSLVGALTFARHTESHVLVEHSLAVYYDQRSDTVSVHNPTDADRTFTLTQQPASQDPSAGGGSVRLRPGQTWRARAAEAIGRTVVTVTPSSGASIGLILLDEKVDVGSGRLESGW